MDVQNYKCAIVQYTCEECLIGDNFTFIFDFNKGDYYKTEEGLCEHLTLSFNLILVVLFLQSILKYKNNNIIYNINIDKLKNLIQLND